jgi:hypothetical protein
MGSRAGNYIRVYLQLGLRRLQGGRHGLKQDCLPDSEVVTVRQEG